MINNCTDCGLHRHRRQEVEGWGHIPADLLFIGEAPGKSEELRGRPFIGATGRILVDAVYDASKMAKSKTIPTYYFTNLIRCRPCDKRGGENREPTAGEIYACAPKLIELWQKVKPKRIIFLGKTAEKYCKDIMKGGIYMYHPAFILRCGGKRTSQYREFVRQLSEIISELY